MTQLSPAKRALVWLAAASAAGLIVALLQLPDRPPLVWDEAARLAPAMRFVREAQQGNLLGLWGWVHDQTFYPFLMPTLNGLVLLATGDPLISAWLPALFFYAAAGLIAGRLAIELGAGDIGGWIAATLCWSTPLLARLAAGAFTETLGACTLLLLIWLLVRLQKAPTARLGIAAGAVAAAGWFTKYDYGINAFVTLAASGAFAFATGPRRSVVTAWGSAIGCSLAVVSGWFAFNSERKVAFAASFIGQGISVTEPTPSTGPDLLFYLRGLYDAEVGLAPLIASLYAAALILGTVIFWRKNPGVRFVLVCLAVWYAMYSLSATKWNRYLATALPLLAVMAGLALGNLGRNFFAGAFRRPKLMGLLAGTAATLFILQLAEQATGPHGLTQRFSFLAPNPAVQGAVTFVSEALREEDRPLLVLGLINELSPSALQVYWQERSGRAPPEVEWLPEVEPGRRTETLLNALSRRDGQKIVAIDVREGSRMWATFRVFPSQASYINLALELEEAGRLRRVNSASFEDGQLRLTILEVSRASSAAGTDGMEPPKAFVGQVRDDVDWTPPRQPGGQFAQLRADPGIHPPLK